MCSDTDILVSVLIVPYYCMDFIFTPPSMALIDTKASHLCFTNCQNNTQNAVFNLLPVQKVAILLSISLPYGVIFSTNILVGLFFFKFISNLEQFLGNAHTFRIKKKNAKGQHRVLLLETSFVILEIQQPFRSCAEYIR